MIAVKILVIVLAFAGVGIVTSCSKKPAAIVLSESKGYEASLFRQNCAVCHGSEGEGKTLDDGKIVPSLRSGEFKFKSEAEIFRQISDGGNGMTPFRGLLTERELNLMAKFVRDDLRRVK